MSLKISSFYSLLNHLMMNLLRSKYELTRKTELNAAAAAAKRHESKKEQFHSDKVPVTRLKPIKLMGANAAPLSIINPSLRVC